MIRIYGGSDDLCEIEGIDLESYDTDSDEPASRKGVAKADARDEIGCIDKDVHFVIGNAEATSGENASGIRVWLHYTDLGVWSVQLLPIEEDVPCPFPVRVVVDGYTAIAEIDAPPGTPVSYVVVEASA